MAIGTPRLGTGSASGLDSSESLPALANAGIGREQLPQEISEILELVLADHATPVARCFLIGLACSAGVECLRALVIEATSAGQSLDDIIGEIHARWRQRIARHASERPAESNPS